MKIHAPTRALVALVLACGITPFTSGQATVNPSTASEIRAAEYDARDQMLAGVESSLQASRETVAAARSRAGELRAEAREEYHAAIEALRQRDTQVRDSLRAARTASPEQYKEAREKLASDYEAFVAAAAQVQANGEVKISRN
jgi:hypothetical protein